MAKPIIYYVSCPECDEELFKGDKLEVERWLKEHDKEGAEWEDGVVEVECMDCLWLKDK